MDWDYILRFCLSINTFILLFLLIVFLISYFLLYKAETYSLEKSKRIVKYRKKTWNKLKKKKIDYNFIINFSKFK